MSNTCHPVSTTESRCQKQKDQDPGMGRHRAEAGLSPLGPLDTTTWFQSRAHPTPKQGDLNRPHVCISASIK